MTKLRLLALVTPCAVFFLILEARSDEARPPAAPGMGYVPPITENRLVGATLDDVGNVALWHFGPQRFRIEIRRDPPAEMIRQLLGRDVNVKQIEGHWRLEEQKGRLVLTGITAGDLKNSQEVVVPITPAGLLRTNLGNRQYNVFEFSVRGRWESIGTGPKVSLSFTWQPDVDRGNPFTATCNQAAIPETLTAALLGKSLRVSHIQGNWNFNWDNKEVVFTGLRSTDRRSDKPVKVAATPVDVLEMNLLGERYRRLDSREAVHP
jgi:hypothetical protein